MKSSELTMAEIFAMAVASGLYAVRNYLGDNQMEAHPRDQLCPLDMRGTSYLVEVLVQLGIEVVYQKYDSNRKGIHRPAQWVKGIQLKGWVSRSSREVSRE